eukprot:13329302-Alexandrium_andersonii.AAC.1
MARPTIMPQAAQGSRGSPETDLRYLLCWPAVVTAAAEYTGAASILRRGGGGRLAELLRGHS